MGGLHWSTRFSLRAAHGGLLNQNIGYKGGLLYYVAVEAVNPRSSTTAVKSSLAKVV